ncbi:hypothetical protein PoMZ_07244 [Pyricularia oryzae]|uniref:RNA polymerase I-specific transcription initiation factor RRN6-like protein n=1 Tax=Pyricularia oryzae TaxID=318829 RepID=A0A4P7NEM2_PYROR|nr:hypothetical protein PoMZ_07244 [Pyricularia oryzae]
MASKKQSALSRANNTRRLNDLVLGHVGRVSYIPRLDRGDDDNDDDNGPGELFINRTVKDVPSFQEVTPFDEWYSPSQSSTPVQPPTGFSAQRSQQHYLLKEHPEAFLGLAADLKSALQEDVALWRTESKRQQSSRTKSLLPLVGVGEITDRTAHNNTCTVLAVVCGEAGDVVRLVRLHEERKSWGGEAGDGAGVLLKTPDSGYEGFWHADGLAISKLQLVSFPRRHHGMRRWLVVQTATETHLFEPEVLTVPIWNKFDGHAGEAFSGPAYIQMTPMLSIKAQGRQNADFMFNFEDEERTPQLAIVDVDGYWNVWHIQSNEKRRRDDLKINASLRSSGQMPDNAFADIESQHELCRVLWTTPLRNVGWLHHAGEEHQRALVVCTRKTLVIFDINGNSADHPETLLPWLVDPKKTESILDIAICPGDPSKIFVLTSTTVFWLELRHSSDASEPFSVTVLLSCPHLRSPIDDTLRMSITRPARDERWLVCIFSGTGSSRTTLFWFRSPHLRSETATFSHQTANLSLPDDASHIRSIALAPSTLGIPLTSTGYQPRNSHFAQLLVLTKSLGLHSALCAITVTPSHHHRPPPIPAPETRNVTDVRYRSVDVKRKKIISQFADAFVVRDDYAVLLEHGRRYKMQQEAEEADYEHRARLEKVKQDTAIKGDFLDLGPVMQIVMERVAAKLKGVWLEGQDAKGGSVSNCFAIIRRLAEDGLASAHLPMTTILEACTQINPGDLVTQIGSHRWIEELAQLKEFAATAEMFEVNDLTGDKSAVTDPSAIFERLLHLWTSSLPADLLDENQAREREALVASIAGEISQAQAGVSVAPRPPAPKEPESLSHEELKGSSQPELGLPSPSATPSSSRAPSESRSLYSDQASSVPDNEVSEHQQDPAAIRLARYATSIGYVPKRDEESALLARWPSEPGSNPADFGWSWAGGEERRLAARLQATRRAKEARRLRMAERRAAMGLSQEPGSGSVVVGGSSQAPRIAASSQAIGTMPQTQTQIMSSQPASQGGVAMSQPVLGRHGSRPVLGKKKAGRGRKIGFR